MLIVEVANNGWFTCGTHVLVYPNAFGVLRVAKKRRCAAALWRRQALPAREEKMSLQSSES